MPLTTATVVEAELFALFGSVVALETVAEFTTEAGVAGAVTTRVMVAELAADRLPRLQTTVVVPVQLPWLGVAEKNVVPPGSVSETLTLFAVAGPPLVTVIVYVIWPLGATTEPFGVLAIDKSAPVPPTVVVAVALLLAVDDSAVGVVTVAVFVIIVPAATPPLTVTTSVKVAGAPGATRVSVAVTVPVPPTAGVEAIQPPGAVNEANVVFAGTVSDSETLAADAVPLFVTVMV
jgi:hypothetical protein